MEKTGGFAAPSVVQRVEVVNLPSLRQTVTKGVNSTFASAGTGFPPLDGDGKGQSPKRPPTPYPSSTSGRGGPSVPTQFFFPGTFLVDMKPDKKGEPVALPHPLNNRVFIADTNFIEQEGDKMTSKRSGVKPAIQDAPNLFPGSPARELVANSKRAPAKLSRRRPDTAILPPRLANRPPTIHTKLPNYEQNMSGLLPTTQPPPPRGNHQREEMWSFLDTPQMPQAAKDAQGRYNMEIDTSPLSSIVSLRTPMELSPNRAPPQQVNRVRNTPQGAVLSGLGGVKRPLDAGSVGPNKRMRATVDGRMNPKLSDTARGAYKRMANKHRRLMPLVDDRMIPALPTSSPFAYEWKRAADKQNHGQTKAQI
ncbi:hypothetical protein HK097_002602 [Rhizophlyctis rosea]|uniref:Uncharacterized protein n=1 Tax=Rhizophlyctis rosea TaxID=64517 RepID=A0AAD5X374_9FUNG|nr:hypothetical protein HK097_002602 [Rhizophlyctis rosea]